MLPDLGLLWLIASCWFALIQTGVGIGWQFGTRWDPQTAIRITSRAAWAASGSVLVAFGCLIYAFVTDDFSVRYVAEHSYRTLPLVYKMTAAWGGHAGSLLLWMAIFALMEAIFLIRRPATDHREWLVALGVLGLIHCALGGLMVTSSHPFGRTFPGIPAEGLDLNPFLQDPLFVIHPPVLYLGYVGFAYVYAQIIGILSRGNTNPAAWVSVRWWSLIAFVGLTLGITGGSFWAYYELGWGGWWYWDPVENAALMPWLLGVALIHAVRTTPTRPDLQSATALLGMAGFLLSILGTFLVRSGVLVSVHAFANDPKKGLFILWLLGFFMVIAIAAYGLRAYTVSVPACTTAPEPILSREFAFRLLNGLMVSATGIVLLGTLYPLILDLWGGTKLSVGPPYFNQALLWIAVPLIGLLGVAPHTRWGTGLQALPGWRAIGWIGGIGFVMGVGVLHFQAIRLAWTGVLGMAMVSWLLLSWIPYIQRHRQIQSMPWKHAGMWLGHLGMAALVWGITMVSHFEREKDVALLPGEQVQLGPYMFTLERVERRDGPNYQGLQAHVHIAHTNGREAHRVYPERRIYVAQQIPVSETALVSSWVRDLYIAFSEPRQDGRFAMRFYYKPMVRWIWVGGCLMAAGGMVAIWRIHTNRRTRS